MGSMRMTMMETQHGKTLKVSMKMREKLKLKLAGEPMTLIMERLSLKIIRWCQRKLWSRRMHR